MLPGPKCFVPSCPDPHQLRANLRLSLCSLCKRWLGHRALCAGELRTEGVGQTTASSHRAPEHDSLSRTEPLLAAKALQGPGARTLSEPCALSGPCPLLVSPAHPRAPRPACHTTGRLDRPGVTVCFGASVGGLFPSCCSTFAGAAVPCPLSGRLSGGARRACGPNSRTAEALTGWTRFPARPLGRYLKIDPAARKA